MYGSYLKIAQLNPKSVYQMWMGYPQEDEAIILDISREGTRKRIDNVLKDSPAQTNHMLTWQEISREEGE